MTSCAFLDCDTQHDFLSPAGALRVPGGETVVPNIARLIEAARAGGVPLVSGEDGMAALRIAEKAIRSARRAERARTRVPMGEGQ